MASSIRSTPTLPEDRSTTDEGFVLPLENGDRLTREEFEHRYDAMPDLRKAELIDGVVYMASPVRQSHHGHPHFRLISWLGIYEMDTPGTEGGDNSSVRLDLGSEPQPDAFIYVKPAYGGSARIDHDGHLDGAPDLVAEVAASSASYDLDVKFHAYRRNGVNEYIVWRVLDRQLDWFILRGDQFERMSPSPDGVLRSQRLARAVARPRGPHGRRHESTEGRGQCRPDFPRARRVRRPPGGGKGSRRCGRRGAMTASPGSAARPRRSRGALIDLNARLRACRTCHEAGYLDDRESVPIARDPDVDAPVPEILLIGQAPGLRATTEDRPFAGAAGEKLRDWLELAGVPREDFWRRVHCGAVTRCYPGRLPGAKGDRVPSPAEQALCRPWLDELLVTIKPRVILLVGLLAIRTFLGRVTSLTAVVGTTVERDGVLYVPLPHPSGVSRWLNEPANVEAVGLAMRALGGALGG